MSVAEFLGVLLIHRMHLLLTAIPLIMFIWMESVTYGRSPRHHIWSFAGGHDNSVHGYFRCPCATDNRNSAPLPPSFVGENYFCATVPVGQHTENIWDGKSCTGSCCHFHSPPWFSVTLPASISDNIEVRICLDSPGGDERLYVQQLQLLVQ